MEHIKPPKGCSKPLCGLEQEFLQTLDKHPKVANTLLVLWPKAPTFSLRARRALGVHGLKKRSMWLISNLTGMIKGDEKHIPPCFPGEKVKKQ